MGQVTVNLNSLRKNAIESYNSLVHKLNENIERGEPFEGGHRVDVQVEAIKEDLDDLRSILVTLACCYDGENLKDLSEEIGHVIGFADVN